MSDSPRGQFVAEVAQNVVLCREHYRLVLRLDRFPDTRPGQFVQLCCRDINDFDPPADPPAAWEPSAPTQWLDPDLLSPHTLLRRPFSLAGRRDMPAGVELDIIHRVVGIGTSWLSRLKPGDYVGLLGPLGNRFTVSPHQRLAVLVAGGVGIPPMLYLAEMLRGRRAVAFNGAMSRDLLPFTLNDDSSSSDDPLLPGNRAAEFTRYGIPSVITTDDGSYGFRGFVTAALERYLDESIQPEDLPYATIYTCGPEAMMKRVAQIAQTRGIECQVAVERAMACGMGTCQSCCIRVKKPDPASVPLPGSDWCYRLACTDGPVFKGADLLW